MTHKRRLVETSLAVVCAISVMSCADTSQPSSPVTPSQLAARPQTLASSPLTGETHLLGEIDLGEDAANAKSCTIKGTTQAGAKITVTCPGMKNPLQDTADKNGVFEIENLPLKNCTVKFEHATYTAPNKSANCTSGGTVPVKFVPTKKKPPPPPPPKKGIKCSQCDINRKNDGAGCDAIWKATNNFDLYQACITKMLEAYNICRNGPPARCIP